MNREIKFKIWDNAKKKFITLKDYQELGAIEVENDGALTLSPRFRFLSSMMIMPNRFIPCQWTGLKDKKGVEIYEGDLLRYSEDTSEISGIDEVFYNEEYGTFEVAINRNRSDTEVLGFYLSRLGIGTKYEVIGNIYESEVTNDNYN